jgi:hypothetical protein
MHARTHVRDGMVVFVFVHPPLTLPVGSDDCGASGARACCHTDQGCRPFPSGANFYPFRLYGVSESLQPTLCLKRISCPPVPARSPLCSVQPHFAQAADGVDICDKFLRVCHGSKPEVRGVVWFMRTCVCVCVCVCVFVCGVYIYVYV